MATNFQITDTDFDSIKNNFKSFLQTQDTYKDYNFDGSGLSILMDLLSYNTFYNSFYINAIANEMFLDSADKRENVVSRAKSLGYIPSSTVSSYGYIDVEAHINKVSGETAPTSESYVTLNPYAVFTTTVQDNDYNFITTDNNILNYEEDGGDYWIYRKRNVKITEGSIYTYYWNIFDEYQKFIIPNKNVDINSLIVRVYETINDVYGTTYVKADSLKDINEESNVYWLYEGDDEKFYMEFGNGILGTKLEVGNVLKILYIISSGAEANGAESFNVGSYSLAESVTEHDAITISNSNYNILNISEPTAYFTKDEKVVGQSTGATGYVYEHDVELDTLKLYSVTGEFSFGETVMETDEIGGGDVTGATALVQGVNSENSFSVGGADIEDINSIKFYAPKHFAAQDRLVTSNDYETIIKHEYPYIDSIVCWGGEEEDDELLGKIFVACKPKSRETLSIDEKTYILDNIIEDRKMIGSNVQIVNADYIYIHPTISVKYNADLDPATTMETIKTSVSNSIYSYCLDFCNKFKSTFYYSGFVSNIDDANEFILGNETSITMVKHFKPIFNVPYNSTNVETLKFSNDIKNYSECENVITSSIFSIDISGVIYNDCFFSANTENNNLMVENSDGVIDSNVGSIDYNDGIIEINNLTVTSTELVDSENNYIIKIYAIPRYLDLVSRKNQVLKIDSDINLSVTPIRENM